MQIPPNWSRPRRQIARVYFEEIKTIEGHESIVKVVAGKLDYKLNENNDSPFVRSVISEIRKLTGAG